MKRTVSKVLLVTIAIVATMCTNFIHLSTVKAEDAYSPSIGIWYEPWWGNKGNYVWSDSFGANADSTFLADVDGDGDDDAIALYKASGQVRVSRSSGTKFIGNETWITGDVSIANSSVQFLADVTGDGKADLITYLNTWRVWTVSVSNGNSFMPTAQWLVVNSSPNQNPALVPLVGDCNGDGLVDAVEWNPNTGEWYVSLSNGTGFANPVTWGKVGYGSSKRFLADVTGDGKSDAVAFQAGEWYVNPANESGNGFEIQTDAQLLNLSAWIHAFGSDSSNQMLADVNNDGKADAVAYFSTMPAIMPGEWQAALSDPDNSRFYKIPEQPDPQGEEGDIFLPEGLWKSRHGVLSANGMDYSGAIYSDNQLTGNIFGDLDSDNSGSADWPGDAPVVYFKNTGKWLAMPADRYYFKSNMWNSWEGGLNVAGRPIDYRPTVSETGMYDSGDPDVIDKHLSMFAEAQIDFVILDNTNTLAADGRYIMNNSIEIAKRIAVWNSDPSHRKIRYAIAVGDYGVNEQFRQVYDWWVTDSQFGGDNYYYLDGKPMIVFFATYANGKNHVSEADPSITGQFTVKYGIGRLPEGSNPPESEYGNYLGWAYQPNSAGALMNSECMFVSPGQDPHLASQAKVSRFYDYDNDGDINTDYTDIDEPDNGGWYKHNWDRVLASRPQMVVIASFNEFAEENSVEPADTNFIPAGSSTEKWPTSSFYWDLTVKYIDELKGFTISSSTASEGGSVNPAGAVKVGYKASQAFTIAPDIKYMIDKITLDGVAVSDDDPNLSDAEGIPGGKIYTLTDVSANHTLEAAFKRSPPTQLSGIVPTTIDNSDGKITGVTDEMEYKLSSAEAYTPVSGSEITGLVPGIYLVRYAAVGGLGASAEAEVTVPAYDGYDVSIGKEQKTGFGYKRTISALASGNASLEGKYLVVQFTGKDKLPKSWSMFMSASAGDMAVGYGDQGTMVEVWLTGEIPDKVGKELDSEALAHAQSDISVQKIYLSPPKLVLFTGQESKLYASVMPVNASDKTVTWSSGNEAVVMVDETGKIVAKAEGTATITVKTTDGSKTATCKITVIKGYGRPPKH